MSGKNKLPFYKRYPRDFLEGTLGLSFELKGAYGIILDLIYIHGTELPDDPRFIAGQLNVSVRKWNSLRSGLIEAGKIQIISGFISNYRAVIELESLSKYQDKQAENARTSKENNDLEKPSLVPKSSQPEPEPEPDIKSKKSKTKVLPKKRAARLSDDWFLPVEWGEWALGQGMAREGIKLEADKFKDFWIAKSGKDATKLDWLATWRNWIRNSKQRKSNGNGNNPNAALEQISRLA